MNGQWIGNLQGTNTGFVVVDLDDLGTHYEGVAFFYESASDQPDVFARIRTPNKDKRFSVRLGLLPMDPDTAEPTDWSRISERYPPGSSFPTHADSDWEVLGDEHIRVTYKSPIGTHGDVLLYGSTANQSSSLIVKKPVSWARFRNDATKFEPYRYVFRGQHNASWRLRTGFHRTGRADLTRFIAQDMGELENLTTNQIPHRFNRNNPVENAAFFSLAQHHGYPTPLLDWTHSPFVAAFFAFRGLRGQQLKKGHRVRVLVFDRRAWEEDQIPVQKLSPARPHLTFLNVLGLNNPRQLPQQALLSVTNMDNLEAFIGTHEKRNNRTYLRAIDLLPSDRKQAMQELALMGITAGSLFPGLDGACEQLRERMFA